MKPRFLTKIFAFLPFLFIAVSAQAAQVAHWSFDESAGAAVAVASDTKYNATPSAGVTFGANGVFGNAVQFPGTVQNNLAFDAVNDVYSGSFTYATWVNMEELRNGVQFFGDWRSPWAFRLFYESNGTIQGLTSNFRNPGGGDVLVLRSSEAWRANTWYHIAVVRDDAEGTVSNYLNGQLIGTATYTPSPTTFMNHSGVAGRKQEFGWKQDDTGNPQLKGRLDESYIYNEALSADQVRNLMRYNNLAGDFLYAPAVRTSLEAFQLGSLFGSNRRDISLDEAVAAAVVGNNASVADIGIANQKIGTGNYAGVQDITGWGSRFNIENLGIAPNGGFTTGIQNSRFDGAAMTLNGFTTGIGMHANAYVTFDLNEIRAAGGYGADELFHFSAFGGIRTEAGAWNGTDNTRQVNMAAIVLDANNDPLFAIVNGRRLETSAFSQDASGTWSFNDPVTDYINPANTKTFDFRIPTEARFLSLVTAMGNNASGTDHSVWGGTILGIDEPNKVYLNKLIGMGATPFGINYKPTYNDGRSLRSDDFAVTKALYGGAATAAMFASLDLIGNGNITLDVSPLSAGTGYGTIRANTCGDTHNIIIPGGGIGIHANGMLTFDIDQLRDYNQWNPADAIQFTASSGAMPDDPNVNGTTSVYSLVVVSDETDILQAWLQGIDISDYVTPGGAGWVIDPVVTSLVELSRQNTEPSDYDFTFGAEAKYLSLMILGSTNGIGNDHGAFYAPTLTLQPSDDSVPEPATWCLLLLAIGGIGFARRYS